MNVIHKNVLVEIPKVEEKKNGVFIPEEERAAERQGTVVRWGEAVPEEVKIQFSSKPTIEYKEYYDGAQITVEGVDYIVMHYESILIIL